ncbi:MAG: hypothetical protein R3338_15225, partial [Thermoanaerobaculia bacterium]|nr:hypothetical protein [Thermoanaerobaculia bacterium]
VEGVEIVEETDTGLIVRGFRPGPVELGFVITDERGSTRTVNREIEIASVLHPDDDLEPAPLAPPIPLEPNRRAWAAIGGAALGAIAIWLQLLWLPRERRVETSESIAAGDEYRQLIERVKRMPASDHRFATLSDGTRRFLSRVDPRLGRALTTTELIDRLSGHFPEWLIGDVRDVLGEGDYAKFSPWGGRGARFEAIIKEANDLAVLDRGERNR